jgi:5'-nucleotidase
LTKELAVKWTLILLIAVIAAGCQNQSKQGATGETVAGASPAVLNVMAPAPASSTLAAPTAVAAADPVAPSATAVTQTPTAGPAATGTAGSSNYTVKKGDTLFRIAREHYGDGKKWQQIAAANPGVTPGTLKAGQTLVMPQ